MRLLEHTEVASSVDVVVPEKMTKVRGPRVKVRTLTMSKHGEQASRSASSNKSDTPTRSRNVPPSLTSASTMDNDYPLHAISPTTTRPEHFRFKLEHASTVVSNLYILVCLLEAHESCCTTVGQK
jgi:hypothetical protein